MTLPLPRQPRTRLREKEIRLSATWKAQADWLLQEGSSRKGRVLEPTASPSKVSLPLQIVLCNLFPFLGFICENNMVITTAPSQGRGRTV